MTQPDPQTRLTPQEQALVQQLNLSMTHDQIVAALKTHLQTAIEIELATIPIYLYTYYSLVRNTATGENIGPQELFANKAGGVIMSVAVEEMLHMSLSSNVLFALGGTPQLYGKAPAAYPTGLPYHNPVGPEGPGGTAVQIPLARLGFAQLWHFLQIEYPEQSDAPPQDRDWDTIGQFYSYIRCLLHTKDMTDADLQHGPEAQGIQPTNYSPNNIDTVYPASTFDPWTPAPPASAPFAPAPGAAQVAVYADFADSHAGKSELLAIASLADANDAIDTICDQGEGSPVAGIGPEPVDDPSKDERSHYYKFLTLQAQYRDYGKVRETLPAHPAPPEPVAPPVDDAWLGASLIAFPDNPTAAGYGGHLTPIANFCSACFQYMLIMTETIYRVPAAQQKRFFNEGLHRSMIWVLDKYIRTIRQIPLPGGQFMAPTFENVDLGPRDVSFAGLKEFGDAAIAAANALMGENPQLTDTLNNVIYYVGVATTATDNGHPMHLPDVGPYWRKSQ